MKILIIDNLTQTFNGNIVRSGLQKSSLMDAKAFSTICDTTFAYCGKLGDGHKFKHLILSELGAKDICLKKNESTKKSYVYVKKFLELIENLHSYDYIIAHCHSTSMINKLNELCTNKKIIFIVHDIIDLTWQIGFSNCIVNLRNNKRNDVKVLTNSNYSIEKANNNYDRRKKFDVLSGDEMFDGYIKHFIFTEQQNIEIKERESYSVTIGRFTPDKFHHKLYNYRKYYHYIIHCGVRDLIRDEKLSYFKRLTKKCNDYRENLSDEDLNELISRASSVILPCYHEGFGFTAFEAGIYGTVPIVLIKQFENGKKFHATSEYLTNAGVKHYVINYDDEKGLYDAIDESSKLTLIERKEISEKLLSYFTVQEYIKERLDFLNK